MLYQYCSISSVNSTETDTLSWTNILFFPPRFYLPFFHGRLRYTVYKNSGSELGFGIWDGQESKWWNRFCWMSAMRQFGQLNNNTNRNNYVCSFLIRH